MPEVAEMKQARPRRWSQPQLLLAVLILSVSGDKQSDATPKPCPVRCECSFGPGKGDCGVTVICKHAPRFPTADMYPDDLDCLFLNSPKLRKLPLPKKEAGFLAIPPSVRRLDLSESRLKTLPEIGLGHLSQLRVLNLEFNELNTLPEKTFHGLQKLKVLWLTGNHYQRGEKEFGKMQQAGNRIAAFHERQFEGLSNLQVLLAHHNKLTELPPGLFADLKKLRVLKLLDNSFKQLSPRDEVFSTLLDTGVFQQLDLQEDSGDTLEDMWEETGTYLSDDFSPGPLPSAQQEL